jgi:hypothetical protein
MLWGGGQGGGGAGFGGDACLIGGESDTQPGNAEVEGGTATVAGDGGQAIIYGGAGFGTNQDGGAASVAGGVGIGTGTGGAVTIAGGAASSDDGGDPFFDSVVLLLDWAGLDGDTSTTDLSNSSHSIPFLGNAEIDTGITFIGENTLLLDGFGDRIQIPNSTDWDFGTDDFTIEIGVYYDDNAELITFISHFDTPNGWWIRRTAGAELHFGVGVTEIYQEAWTGAINTFFNIAVSRQGTDLRVFVDGVQLGATVTDSTSLSGSTSVLYIGNLNGLVQAVTGNIGATRITKGVARYTTDFTPPAAFYPTFLGGGGTGGDINIIGGIGGNTLGSINIQPISTAAGETTELRFLELVASGTNYIGFKAPDALAGDVMWTLPTTDSTGTQGLVSDGSGTLSWADAVSGQTATLQTLGAAPEEIIGIPVPSGEGFGFEIHCMGTQDSTGDTVFERIFGAIRNQGGTTALVGGNVTDRTEDAGAATWAITVAADDGADELTIDVTGEAAHTIDWKIRVELLNV